MSMWGWFFINGALLIIAGCNWPYPRHHVRRRLETDTVLILVGIMLAVVGFAGGLL